MAATYRDNVRNAQRTSWPLPSDHDAAPVAFLSHETRAAMAATIAGGFGAVVHPNDVAARAVAQTDALIRALGYGVTT